MNERKIKKEGPELIVSAWVCSWDENFGYSCLTLFRGSGVVVLIDLLSWDYSVRGLDDNESYSEGNLLDDSESVSPCVMKAYLYTKNKLAL